MTLLYIHIAAVYAAVAIIAFADHQAFNWIFGKKETLDKKHMLILHVLTWAALLALIVSGTLLFLPKIAYLLTLPLFVIKLLFVAVLVVNAVLIGVLMEVALTKSFASLTFKDKLPLLVSGAISSTSWISVIAIGLYLFY